MSEFIDRLARVAHDENRKERPDQTEWSVEWGALTERQHEDLRSIIRCVLAAAREPTEAMVDAAWASSLAEDAFCTWQDMIDEALK